MEGTTSKTAQSGTQNHGKSNGSKPNSKVAHGLRALFVDELKDIIGQKKRSLKRFLR